MDEVKWYENNTLDMIKNTIKNNMNTACSSFNAIGYYLKNVRDRELYMQDGYNSIWDFARDEFGISKSSASRFMAINERFGDGPMLLDEYKNFSSSKLSEMLTLTDSQIEQVTPGMTRDQIREMKPKKEKLAKQEDQAIQKSDWENGIFENDNDGYGYMRNEIVIALFEKMYAEKVCEIEEIETGIKFEFRETTYTACRIIDYIAFYGKEGVDFRTSVDRLKVEYKHYKDSIAPAQQKDKKKETGTHQVSEESPTLSMDVNQSLESRRSQQGTNVNTELPKKEQKRCLHKAGHECNIKGCSDVARDLGMECNGICCWECKEREGCGAACNVSAHERRQRQSVIKDPISVINEQENVIDAEFMEVEDHIVHYADFMEVEDHIVHFDFNVENYGGNWEESIYRFINQANSKRFDYAHDDVERKYLEDVGKNLKELVELKKKQQVIVKKEQPELPRLRNNEQRKEFIDNYTSWPVWIDQPLTEERYYRYDLSSKVALVVKVSRKHSWENYKESKNFEYAAEQYYLLGIKASYGQKFEYVEDPTRTFYECNTNKSTLVDYLKEVQKEKVWNNV